MAGWCGEAVAAQRPLCRNFSNHAAERYGSTRGARSPGVNPWLVARSVSYHGRAVSVSHLCCPEGISAARWCYVLRRDPLRGTVDVGDSKAEGSTRSAAAPPG